MSLRGFVYNTNRMGPGLSPEGHHTEGEMAQISSRLQRQCDPYQTDTTESTTKLCP